MDDNTTEYIECNECLFQYAEGTAHKCFLTFTQEISELKKEMKELRSQIKDQQKGNLSGGLND